MPKNPSQRSKNTHNPYSLFFLALRFAGGAAAGWYGGQYLSGKLPHYGIGLILESLAAFLLYSCFPKRWEPLAPEKQLPEKRPKTPDLPGLAKNLSLLLLLALGQWCFFHSHIAPALLVTLGTGAFLVWMRFENRPWPSSPALFKVPETKILFLVLGVTSLIVFPQIGHSVTGLCVDESNNICDAAGIAQYSGTGPFATGWGGTPTFPDFIVAGFFKVFGIKLWAARLVSILASLAALWFFYHWCRFFMGDLASAMATFWMGISWWYLYFALSVWHTPLLYLSMIGAFYFMEKGFRQGRSLDFALSGLFAAACVMNYVPGRSVPIMMACTILGYCALWRTRFLKTYWNALLLTGLAFLLLLGPFLFYAHAVPGEVWGRVQTHWIQETARSTGSYLFLPQIYFWSLVSFWTFNPTIDFHFPAGDYYYVDPYAAGFFILGALVSLLKWKRPAVWVLLPGVFWGISANALGIQYVTPPLNYFHAFRPCLTIPFLYFGAGLGLDWILRNYQLLIPKVKWTWLGPFLGLIILGSFASNLPVILGYSVEARANWSNLGFAQMKEAEILNQLYPTHHLIVEGNLISSIVNFMTIDKARFKIVGDPPPLPVTQKVEKNVAIFFANWEIAKGSKDRVQTLYPGTVWTEVKNAWGGVYLVYADIPLKDIRTQQAGSNPAEALP